MTFRHAAIMALVVLATACGGDDAAPSRAGVNNSSSEAELPAAASVNLSDPERNQALDELDAILAADAGPEPVDQAAPVAGPVPTETDPEPNPTARPTPSFTPDAPTSQGPVVLADDGGIRITAEPIGLHLLRIDDDKPALARWPGRNSGEAFASHVVHDRFAAAEIELIDPGTAAPLPADAYTVAAADGWVILVEGSIAGHSYAPADGFVMTRSVSSEGTEGWFVAGESRDASLFVFPTTDGPPVRVDLDRLA
ncbi:hypothetical protein [Euzebya pacifica]|uniref:hypothetical protein n=1 Tax=Euzebya pacifica TaxID=1608957 RepID=UPI0013E0C54A|nr:hypothetical protein [Euzebya pacifica]